jgi:hypothetical protein
MNIDDQVDIELFHPDKKMYKNIIREIDLDSRYNIWRNVYTTVTSVVGRPLWIYIMKQITHPL